MSAKVFHDNRIVDATDAKISVFDRGFLYGDSVYEVMRTAGGNPVDLTWHLERLEKSAHAIYIPLVPRMQVQQALAQTLAAAGNDESYVRIVVTRGTAEIGLDIDANATPTLLVMVRPLTLPPQNLYEEGAYLRIVDVVTTPKLTMDPSVKSGNYLSNIMALRQARAAGAHEALRLNSAGYVAEGASSNVFIVKDGALLSPPLSEGLLPGITRKRVMVLCESHGIAVHERRFRREDVYQADGVFITSSVRGIMPVRQVDEVEFDPAGPVATTLRGAYARFLSEVARAAPLSVS